MGRITLFTTDQCPFSLRAKHELELRGLPYEEISLTKHPDRRDALFLLSRSNTTPQSFFNTRHIGGYDATVKELKSWDKDKKFKTPHAKYSSQIAKYPSPSNPNLAIPEDTQPPRKETSVVGLDLIHERKTVRLNLPGGVQTFTVWELTSLLTTILPLSNLHYHLMTYKQSVTGAQATSALSKYFDCTREEAETIGRDLHAIGLLHHVTYAHPFSDTSKFYYRLQYNQTPHIINTLYLCDGEDEIGHDTLKANALVERAGYMLGTITQSCLDPNEKIGGIQYKQGATHELFGELQETLCCFQSVDISNMESTTLLVGAALQCNWTIYQHIIKTRSSSPPLAISCWFIQAFGLNIYNIMLQFAFFKLGLPAKESHQQPFLQGVKFNIGGRDYSFHEWLGVISEGRVCAEPDTRDSPRRSILVPKRPSISPLMPVPLGAERITDNSESQSSMDSSRGGQKSMRQSMKDFSINRTTSTRGSSVTDSSSTAESGDLNPADYRIYFATHYFWSRASAIARFTPENVDKELTIMAFAFCENDDNVHVDEKKGELHLSNIFSFYRKYLGSSSESRGDNTSKSYTASIASDVDIAKIVYKYSEGTKKLQIQKVLPSSGSKGKVKLTFHEDDWTTNAAKKEFVEFKPSSIDANCARF